MRIKVSDYIAKFFVDKGITQVFSVVGGGAMHLNDSFGHHPQMHCTYNHHEQASAMAAEAYTRVSGKLALVCVTSGPGGINALNGVAGAYMDSIPMIVISGQMKRMMTTRYTGLKVRSLGSQEFDIISAVHGMTKYADMIVDAMQIRSSLEKAYKVALSGRPGPCWLDIPLDIQGSYVDTEKLSPWNLDEVVDTPKLKETYDMETIIGKLKASKRPVLYVGNGIRISGGIDVFNQLIETLKIPVVTCWDSIDLIASENPLYCGRGGIMGDRAGNFAVQNSDLLICIGTRLNILQVGYNTKTWAREAWVIMVDIDPAELSKPTVRVDLPICEDAKLFMEKLGHALKERAGFDHEKWIRQCDFWKHKYPVMQKRQYEADGRVNIYAFMDRLSRSLPEGAITVVANGSASVVGSQTYYIKPNSRFIMNCAISSMGYDLPAAVGASIAAPGQDIYCIAGDGSIMMNLQELQTIATNKLPVKLFVINNEGYHQVRQTQNNIFNDGLIGVGPESGDLGFPNFEKLADTFGLSYKKIECNSMLEEMLNSVLVANGGFLCEVMVSIDQIFEPKSATKKLSDGTLVSPPLEDLAPFLSREELANNMYIPLVD